MKIYIFEDDNYQNFYPLVHFRTIFELKCGCFRLFEKIERNLKINDIGFICRKSLAEYITEEFPLKMVNTIAKDYSLLINGRIIIDEKLLNFFKRVKNTEKVFMQDGVIIAAVLDYNTLMKNFSNITDGKISSSDFENIPVEDIHAKTINYTWDLIKYNGEEIVRDFKLLSKNKNKKILGKINKGVILLNKKNILIGNKSIIQPGVVLNAENGPIIIGKNVTIMSNAVIFGPAFIGDYSIVKVGAKIYPNTTIGEVCKVGGEIDSCIIQSYSNKQHDGYLGHSYIGSWANFGADTNNSDLKNNYSNVKVNLNGKIFDTGTQHFGMLFGDHSKTGINMMFDTGTNIGACCNLYGTGLPPRYIPSFVRGTPAGPLKTHSVEMALETSRLVMARRNIQITAAYEKLFKNIFTETETERQKEKIL